MNGYALDEERWHAEQDRKLRAGRGGAFSAVVAMIYGMALDRPVGATLAAILALIALRIAAEARAALDG